MLIDEDELLEAFNKGDILKKDVEVTYQTLSYLENTYINNLEELVKFINYLSKKFKLKNIKEKANETTKYL